MKNISERVQFILKHYNLTAGSFADKMGIQKSSISHLLSGRNKPSFQFLSKLVKAFPEINLNWFITGDGDIFNQTEQNIEYANLKHLDKQPEKLDRSVENEISANNMEQKALKPNKLVDKTGSNANMVENIIMVYANDTFKILKKQ